MRGRKWLKLLTSGELGRYLKDAKSSGSATKMFVGATAIIIIIIIIIIICYHFCAGYLQVYTWKKHVSRAGLANLLEGARPKYSLL